MLFQAVRHGRYSTEKSAWFLDKLGGISPTLRVERLDWGGVHPNPRNFSTPGACDLVEKLGIIRPH